MSRALGRYELLRPIARGGMAEVFLARRRAAGVEKLLVVKRMRPERASDARFLELFVREAKLSMSLAHQNIVPVFDFGRIDDQVFIAMERVEGRDLGSTLARAGAALPPLVAAFVAAECCQALDYAHRRRGPDGAELGIVHRDVTPRNVMLSWSGEVKLTDFGIAALAGEKASVIGTPGYMAPEQARGESLDPRADVYAVGMVLREALTGTRPRPGSEREVVLVAARAGTLAPWPPGFDSPLVAIVDRATSADREARYPEARAMLDELDGFIVAERAANKSDAPARRLAAWLAETWKDEREESPIDEAIEASHLVSFLDDGGLDAVGTNTERSMAATADEEVAPAAPAAPGSGGASAAAPGSGGAAAAAAAGGAAVSANAPAPARRRWIPIAAVAIASSAVAAVALSGRGSAPARPAATPQAPARPVAAVVPPPDAADAADAARPDAAVADARITVFVPADAAPERPRVRPRPVPPIAPPPPLAAQTHKVTVTSRPWSYFTVDDLPLQHQTLEVLHLAAGAHVLHFARDTIHRDIVISVPADDSLAVVQDMSH
ncbi:MAG: serine/threonine-protein kinase [Kofleriaceae bacterium]